MHEYGAKSTEMTSDFDWKAWACGANCTLHRIENITGAQYYAEENPLLFNKTWRRTI